MTSTTSLGCFICQEPQSIDNLRFLNCGHGYCLECLTTTKRDHSCAVCRKHKGTARLGHPVYLYVTDTDTDSVQTVKEQIQQLNDASSSVSVKQAIHALRATVQLEHNQDNLTPTLSHLTALTLPLTSKVETLLSENQSLRNNVTTLEIHLHNQTPLIAQARDLQRTLQQVTTSHQETEAALDACVEEVKTSRDRVKRRDRAIDKAKIELDSLRTEQVKLQNALNAEQRRSKALAKQVKLQSKQVHNQDESLIIEFPATHHPKKRRRNDSENVVI